MTSRTSALALFALALVLVSPNRPPAYAFGEDPTWPCIQRKVPEISPGQVWNGPPMEGLDAVWKEDPQIKSLARDAAERRTELEAAKQLVADYARSLGGEKNQKLTLLFAGILEIINKDRASIISGITRYQGRQAALAELIEKQAQELASLADASDEASQDRYFDLEDKQLWDTRVYDEREKSLIYICEQPVILEQRAFLLGREIMGHLD